MANTRTTSTGGQIIISPIVYVHCVMVLVLGTSLTRRHVPSGAGAESVTSSESSESSALLLFSTSSERGTGNGKSAPPWDLRCAFQTLFARDGYRCLKTKPNQYACALSVFARRTAELTHLHTNWSFSLSSWLAVIKPVINHSAAAVCRPKEAVTVMS